MISSSHSSDRLSLEILHLNNNEFTGSVGPNLFKSLTTLGKCIDSILGLSASFGLTQQDLMADTPFVLMASHSGV